MRNGRLGKLQKVTVSLPTSTAEGGPFASKPVPAELNWDFWLGQAPSVDYCPERCHFTFRWWYEYSGGIMTDWGAHHMDIAHWGMGVGTVRPADDRVAGQAAQHSRRLQHAQQAGRRT